MAPEPRSEPRQLPSHPERRKRYLRLDVLGVVLGILSLVVAIYPFTVREVSVEIGAPLIADRAFSSPFSIRNTGYWPLKHLRVRCWVRVAEYERGLSVGDSAFEEHLIPRLAVGDPASIPLPSMPFDGAGTEPWEKIALSKAEVSVLIEFGRFALPNRSRRGFRFDAVKDATGAFRWLPQPADESDWERFDRVVSGDNRPR